MTALITGASSGIGRDIARLLAAQGHELILVARRRDRLEQLAAELPVPVTVVPADLSEPGAGEALYRRLEGRQVDILVNNAGFGAFGLFEETPLARDRAMLAVNVAALHELTKLYYTDFKRRDAGYILNVASSAAFLPGPLLAEYYAGKAYVLRLTQALYEELRRSGSHVRVSALCPGPVRTEFDTTAGVTFSARGLPSDKVARAAVRGMFRGKLVIVPGLTMKLVRFGARFLPDKWLLRLCWHAQKRKES
ncbi:MAG: SDR family oxidoreductase [Clostridia bacterium]|nr:SDR family oxidoreductase [Clostridia bacterium]